VPTTPERTPDPTSSPGGQPNPVEVFWRLGSPACRDLRVVLLDHAVESTWRNVATDPGAREFVEAHGTQVPLVRVGTRVLCNPSWADLAPLIGRDTREKARPPAPRRYGSAGACSPPQSLRFG
jgi:hypothetical protein